MKPLLLTIGLSAFVLGCASRPADVIDAKAAAEAAQAAEDDFNRRNDLQAMPPVTAAEAAARATDAAGLEMAIRGNWRDPKNVARDSYRHPHETLAFFGVRPEQTVVEITPGGAGWYAEILAPYLRERGQYIAAVVDPALVEAGRSRDYQQKTRSTLQAKLAAAPTHYDRARVVAFDPKTPVFGPADSADVVLTFRNVHNWVGDDNAAAWFQGFHAVLKPGGTLGVVDHRARPGTPLETMKDSGYLTEAMVIQLATAAGFRLDAKSEINANPRDTANHKNGVWTLFPTGQHEPEDAARYREIGESDRMTLRFVKPSA